MTHVMVTTNCFTCGKVVAVPIEVFNTARWGSCSDAGETCRGALTRQEMLTAIGKLRAQLKDLEREHERRSGVAPSAVA